MPLRLRTRFNLSGQGARNGEKETRREGENFVDDSGNRFSLRKSVPANVRDRTPIFLCILSVRDRDLSIKILKTILFVAVCDISIVQTLQTYPFLDHN